MGLCVPQLQVKPQCKVKILSGQPLGLSKSRCMMAL